MGVNEAVDQYFNLWNAPDEAARQKIVKTALTDDATYVDAMGAFTGHEQIAGLIGLIMGTASEEVTVVRTSVIDDNHGVFRFNWALKNMEGTVLIGGMVVGELADDGRLSRVASFFGDTALSLEADAQRVIEVSRVIAAPVDRVWQLVSDQELYAKIAPNLSGLKVISGEGKGMERECANFQGQWWKEFCTDWQDGRSYAFDVDTSTYPYPVAKLAHAWSVEPADGGTRVGMSLEVEPLDHPASLQYVRMLKWACPSALGAILDFWQDQAEAGRPTS